MRDDDACARLGAAFPVDEARRVLATFGRLTSGVTLAAFARAAPRVMLRHLAAHDGDLARAFAALDGRRFPGRSEALLAVARALGERLGDDEYALPEDGLADLQRRAAALVGQRVRATGAAGHKGRIGDAVERLLVGTRHAGKHADHPAAEIKTVPVSGDRVVERVKLGVISATSNPLDKCACVLFVFVEARGDDHFVRGSDVHDFAADDWARLWRDGLLVETSAGVTAAHARGLYLVPRWFREARLWPAPSRSTGVPGGRFGTLSGF